MSSVLVVGALNVDLVMRVARIPMAGETVADGRFRRGRGGKGANQAVAAARLGARVAMVGRVGADGGYAIEGLQRESVDTSLVGVDEDGVTGTALILVDDAGENVVAVAPGANAALELPSGFDEALAARTGVLLASLEVPLDVVTQAAERAAAAGWQVVVNPAPAPPAGTPWPRTSVLTPNVRELRAMSGEDGVEAGVRRLAAETGCRVVATLGADGALVCADGALLRVDAVRVEALDTTGAGDAFNGALAVGLAAGLPLVDAVEGANTAAAYATTALGAQGGMLTRAELRARLRRPELQDAWR